MNFHDNPFHTVPTALDLGDFGKDLSQHASKLSKEYCSEITVTIKDDEKRLTKKTLVYETYTLNEDDPVIHGCIAEALKEFNGEPTDVKVRINLTVL